MTPDDFRRLRELFLEATRLPTSERDSFIRAHCDDPRLRERIEAMLRHDADSPGDPVGGLDGLPEPADDFEPYRIIEPLGEGGFCIVYLAEQEQPVRRRVALKLIKPGMETRSVIARFEAERQVLALLNHPSIAKVHDFGMTRRGRLLFVMEYVPGEPISAYCDRCRLPIRERLALFVQVCEAVQHAHQMAIIHRDIKPSNVLVMELDGKPLPKVIDFGIAKSLDPLLIGGPALTVEGHFLGTPDYMSPEQAESPAGGIDTRTDVYSLGVVLYELLAGARPFDLGALCLGDLRAVPRLLREAEPPQPSQRLRELPSAVFKEVAALRAADPRSLLREIQEDLDWITLRAISRDREDRYGSAADLAADIERYRRREPVTATPPTLRYRARKLWARRKAVIVAAATAFVGLVAAVIVSLSLYLHAQRALRRSEGLRYTALSATALSSDPDAALLLALEAHERYQGIESRNAVLAAISETVNHKVLARHTSPVRFCELSPDDALLATSSLDGGLFLWDMGTAAFLRSIDGYRSAARPRFSPDGRRLFAASDDGAVAIWSLDSGNRLAPQTAPLGDLAWADWAPEHRIYVTISPDGIACIVDDSSGREVRRFETGARQLTSATLSADGRRVALGTRGGDIAVWDLLEAAEPTRIKRYGTLVHSLRFSPDGGRLLSADYSKAHLWNASTGERLFDFDGHEPLLQAAAMSSDGRRVATVADDRRAIVWDALSGDKLRVFPVEASKLVGVHFSGNGRRLVTTSINGTASVWDLETDTEIEVLRGHQGKVVKAAFTSDGRRVVTSAAGDASVALWDVDRRAVPRFDHKRYVNAFDLSTDGTRLLVSDRSGNTVIWDSAGGSRIGTLSGHRGEIISCRLSRDGRRAVTSSQDRTTRLWDVETGRVLRKYPAGRGFQGAQLGPDGRWIAVLSADGSEVLIADAESGDTLQSLMTDSRETTCFGFSPDGELVWAATKQGVILWRRATGERLSVLRGHEEHIRSVRFHPGGGLVVTASQDKSARVWELPAAKERCTLVHSSGVFSAAIHPAGDRVLTRSADEVARVWDAQSGALLLSLRSHEARLIAAVYAPDGRWVLTTSFDHTARLWDAATGEEFLTFRGHSDRLIGSVCFTPDGRSAITGSLDGTVRIWPLDPVALARLYTPRSFFPGEREKYGIGADTK